MFHFYMFGKGRKEEYMLFTFMPGKNVENDES